MAEKYLKVTRYKAGTFVGDFYCIHIDLPNFLSDEIDNLEAGEKLQLEVVEMTQEKYAELPEFEGW